MKKSLIVSILIASVVPAIAQITATSENGKEVILNEDGTWKYKEIKII